MRVTQRPGVCICRQNTSEANQLSIVTRCTHPQIWNAICAEVVLSKLYPVIATEGGHFNRPDLEFFKAKYVISSSTFLSSSRGLTSYRTVITSESNPMHFPRSPYLKGQTWYFYLWPFSHLNSPWARHSVSHTKEHVLSSKANGKAMEERLIQESCPETRQGSPTSCKYLDQWLSTCTSLPL